MPRKARLDIPKVLYHVFARARDQQKLFICDDDRLHFFDRLKSLVSEFNTQCYAWALLPNQFNLLIRPEQATLKKLMRKLLIAYTAGFKQRHKVDGNVFKGRYHSIICQETYFEQLIVHIHSLPVHHGVCLDIENLNTYPWTGHPSMLGASDYIVDSDGVKQALSLFSKDNPEAINQYHQKLQEICHTDAVDFSGGGWMRSTASSRKDIWHTTDDEIAQYDSRILGTSEFVQEVLKTAKILSEKKPSNYISIHHLIDKVSQYYQIPTEKLFEKCQLQSVSHARCVICHIEIDHLKRSGAVVGKLMKIKGFSAIRCASRGQKIYASDPELQDLIGFPVLV